MIFGSLGLNPPLAPQGQAPPRGRSCRGWGYPKMKIEIIFEIPTIENSLWPPQVPPLPGRPWGGIQGGRPFKPKN